MKKLSASTEIIVQADLPAFSKICFNGAAPAKSNELILFFS
jgi:hypothetical protein